MSELFSPAEVASESPRLRWLRQHGLTCWETKCIEPGNECPETGEIIKAWTCCTLASLEDCTMRGYTSGDTADEACAAYARAHNIPLWNE